jgi:hypothetical protein
MEGEGGRGKVGHISLLCSLSAWPSSSSRRQRAGRPSSCAAAWPLPPPPPPQPQPPQPQPRLRRRSPLPPSRLTSSRTSCRSASPPSSASSGSSGTSRDTRRSSARWPGRCARARGVRHGLCVRTESWRRPKLKLTNPPLPHRPRAQIAGLSVNEAIAQLAFSPSRRAASVRKAITRATQQADMRHQLPQVRPHVVPALPSTLLPVSPPHPPPPTTPRAGQAHD